MVKPSSQMDCYIIASTLEGGWGFNILEKEDGLTREEEGRRRKKERKKNL